ncbi:hypothetical protein HXX76_010490 [Chlamydomonas incerta]|uniref:YkgJ family cysteine cluster protein n=1 Tax=Chlamydomonas incerta TaxID=51695 RepID=A0A835SU58_CHLIN|nr:hypothetical protein HXX76_010490 [Chlamydomonas incerta]|eukprot:KAG2428344.1 hypothetical protein HXX76_010490 [Chlamydomonas incerta]
MTLEPFKSLVAGRRFSCTMCGKCCTGDGEIWLAPEEIPRIAKHLNLSTQRFLDTYTKQYSKYSGWRMLKTAGDSGQSCVFLSPLDGKTCLVHSVRPSQCSTYPWWPELMHDGEWEWEKTNICEGFDHPDAPPLDVEEAARQLKEANTMTQLRLLASTVRVTPKEMDWANRVLVWEEEEDEEGGSGAGEGEAARAKGTPTGQGGKPGSAAGKKPEKGGKRN